MKKDKKEETLTTYKGFNKDMTCRGFKFEIGKEYKEKNNKICEKGFHACINPLDIFGYYTPADSVFAETEQSGNIQTHDDDSKVCSSTIKIKAELSLHSLIDKGIKFIFERTKLIKENINTEKNKHASNSGYSGAAFTIGVYSSADTNIDNSIACAVGICNKAKGVKDSWIVLAEWEQNKEDKWIIKSVQSIKVDGKKIKENTFYELKNRKFVILK